MTDDPQRAGARDGALAPSATGTDARPARYETVVDAVGDGIYQLDLEGRFVAVNDAIVEATGYSREELLGEHASLVVAEADVEAIAAEIRELLREGSDATVTRTLTVRTADGEAFPVETKFGLLREDGEVAGTVGVVRDIAESREHEHELRRERDLVDQLLEAVSTSVVVLEGDGEIVRANERAKEHLEIGRTGVDRAAVGDRDVYDEDGTFVAPEERPYMRVFETGEPVFDWECQIDLHEQGRRWFSVNVVPIYEDGAESEVQRAVVTAEDITRLKTQARQLRRQRDELASELDEIFERVDDAFYALDEEFRFTYVNERAEELLQQPEAALLGRSVWDVFPEARETPAWESFHEALETQEPTSYEVHYEPLEFWVEANVYPSETGLSVYFRDVTERKERERELERYETVVETTREGIYATDAEGRFTMANDAYLELTGHSREELLGTHTSEVIPEADHADVYRERRELRAGEREVGTREGHYETPDGTRRAVETRFTVLTDEDGGFLGTTGVTRDVTDRREREQRLRRERDRFTAVFETIPEAVVHVRFEDGEPLIRNVNSEFEDVFGYPREELTGASLNEYIVPEAFEDEAVRMDEATASLERIEREVVRETADGEREFLFRGVPFEADGEAVEGIGVYIDITERKARERELERYETLFEESTDVNAVLDPDGTFRHLTPSVEHVLGYEPDELVGENAFEFIHPEDREETMERFAETVDEDEDRPSAEYRFRHADGSWRWLEARGRNMLDDPRIEGIVAYTRDITERKARQRELEESEQRYRALAEQFPNGTVCLFDEDLRYTLVAGEAFDRIPVSPAEIEGHTPEEVFPAEMAESLAPLFQDALAGEAGSVELKFGGRYWNVHTAPVLNEGGEVLSGLLVSQDITERREHERELEQYRALTRAASDAIVTIDESSTIRSINPAIEETLGYAPDDLVGEPLTTLMPDRFADQHTAALGRYLRTGERHLDWDYVELPGLHADGHEVPLGISFSEIEYGGRRFFTGILRDISERKERERQLEEHETIVETIPDGVYVLDEDHCFDLVNDAFCEMTGYSREELLGTDAEIVSTQEGHERGLELREQLRAGEIDVAVLEETVQTAAGDTIEAEIRFVPLHDENGDFRGTAGVLRDISERKERERELERQREQLAALDELNGVVREINEALVRQSTREEVERVVCERLAASDSYRFAWIGEVEPHGDTIRMGAEAGSGGYVDDLDISIAPDDPTGQGPTARALRTGEMQVIQDIFEDPAYELWRDRAEEYGFRSSAAIPIAYEGTTYGVLNVYAARPHAFDESEREVIGQLGEVVGHAINAIERKQALMSDEVVELEFQIRDVTDEFGVSTPDEGRITFDRAIPVGDDEFLEFGTATGDALGTLEALVDRVPHFAELTVLSEGADEVRYELHLDEPPVLSAVAAHGGRVQQATIEDGNYRMTVELPPSVSVRRITETVREAYPGAEILAQRQTTRRNKSPERIRQAFVEELTDRQRTVLETAYYAGFFEWPRESTGEDVAASMDIAPATLHQHLRAGQNKLLEALFSDGAVES